MVGFQQTKPVDRKTVTAGMSRKIAAAVVICLAVRVLVGQAPPLSNPLLQEEEGARGYKQFAPLPDYLDPKKRTDFTKMKKQVNDTLRAQPSPINEAGQK